MNNSKEKKKEKCNSLKKIRKGYSKKRKEILRKFLISSKLLMRKCFNSCEKHKDAKKKNYKNQYKIKKDCLQNKIVIVLRL